MASEKYRDYRIHSYVPNILDQVPRDLSITVRDRPTYIQKFFDSTDQIVFVHKKPNYEVNDYDKLGECIEIAVTEFEDLDITGSPLKCSLDYSNLMCKSVLDCPQNSWTEDEEKHFPLTIARARKMLLKYVYSRRNSIHETWCVCDASDSRMTVLISAKSINSDMLCVNVIRIIGYKPYLFIKEDLKKVYNWHVNDKVYKHSAVIDIIGTKIQAEHVVDKQSEVKGYVSLGVAWTTEKSEIPIKNSILTMYLQAYVGHSDAESVSLWQELVLLELYTNTLSQYATQKMLYTDWLPTKKGTLPEMDLTKLAVEIANKSHSKRLCEQKDQGADLQKIVKNVESRTSLDLTDQLWSILIYCSTYGMLVDCLNAFISQIAYNPDKVFIAQSNETFLAELIRGIIAGKMAVPTFSGTQPIEILIELGIEKLKKDYVHICSVGDVASEEDLYDLFKFEMENEIMRNVHVDPCRRRTMIIVPKVSVISKEIIEKEMKILGQFETLVETLLLVPSDLVQYVMKTAYDHFLGSNSPITSFNSLANNKLYELSVTLPARLPNGIGERYIKGYVPTSLHFKAISDCCWYKYETAVHLSTGPIIPPNIYTYAIERDGVKFGNKPPPSKVPHFYYTLMKSKTFNFKIAPTSTQTF